MNHVEKRSEILRTALDLIATNGFHGAPMAMIADRSQVAMGTIYRCFESKDHLILALREELEGRFREEVMREFPESCPLRERFLHVGRIFVRYCLESPADFLFLEQFHTSPYGATYRRDQILGCTGSGVLHELLEEAQREQILKPLPHAVLSALIF